jgi:hypothetical protein
MNDVDELLQVEPKLTPFLIGRGTKRVASQNRIAINVRDKLMSSALDLLPKRLHAGLKILEPRPT